MKQQERPAIPEREAPSRPDGRAFGGGEAELFRVTLASIGDGVITTDRHGKVTFLNPVAESLTGWTQQAAVSRSLTEIFHIVNQETRAEVENPALRSLKEGVIVGLANHTLLIARDGSERNIDDSAAPIMDDKGEVAGSVLVFRDITERYRQERLVVDGLAYAENILRTLPHAFLVLDKDLRVVTANAAFYRRFAVDPGQTEGLLVYELGSGQWNIPKLRELLEEILPRNGHAVEEFEVEHDFPGIGKRVVALNARRVNKPGNHSELILLVIEDITERKQAEERRAVLAAIVDSSDDAIVGKTLDGVITSWNPGAETIFGYTAAEAVGRNITLIIPDELRPEEDAVLARLRRGEKIDHFETERRAKDGRRVMISLSVSPIKDAAGRIIGAAKVARDITRRRQQERELGESESRKAALIRAALDAVIMMDHEGRIVEFNPAAERAFGARREDVIGGQMVDLIIPPSLRERHRRGFAHYLATGDGPILDKRIDMTALRSDGTEFPCELTVTRIATEGPPTFAAFIRDITDRKQAEQDLRDSEMRYRRLFQSAKDGVLILDADTGKVLDANAYVSALVGLEPDELTGKELYEIGMFADESENRAAFRELQEKKYIRYEHLPLQNQRGQKVEVEVVANIYREDHRLVAQCNIRDISQRVAMEEKIRAQTEQLASESRRKDEFLAMLSHELRNPLAPIRSAVHLLRTQERPGGENIVQTHAHDVIERQVANLTKIVSDLLEVSRVVSGRIRLSRQVLDLNQVVRHAVETAQPLFDLHKHTLTVSLCGDGPAGGGVWVSADATRMEEVFVNILNNAAKYTPDGGVIEVHCENPRGTNHAQVRVRDNGVGIEEKVLPRIFDLFTQADRSLARSAGGLGIGLSLAHKLMALHGGSIEAHSPPDGAEVGSEFVVTLPLAPAPDRPEPAPPELPVNADGLRVLVVDDNIDLVMMLSSSLRQRGYGVRVAYTGPEALKVAGQWRPDIMLLDIGLPGLDGYEVARRLRSDAAPGTAGAPMRILALTGYGRETDLALAREAGFDGHLIKPVDFKDLEKMMAAPPSPATPAPPSAPSAGARPRTGEGDTALPRTGVPPTRAKIRVLCVDDNREITTALGRCIEREPDMEIAGSLPSADDLVAEVGKTRADVVLLDMKMPGKDPLDAVRELTGARPAPCGDDSRGRVIVFSGDSDQETVDSAARAGACGFLSKDAAVPVMLEAIRAVARGDAPFGVWR